ncbi:hypothetical protein ACO1MO_13915, partial [Staphylococcus aureus]
LTIQFDTARGLLQLVGRLGVQELAMALVAFEDTTPGHIRGLDLTQLTQLEPSGAMLLQRWADDLPILYANDAQRILLEAMAS